MKWNIDQKIDAESGEMVQKVTEKVVEVLRSAFFIEWDFKTKLKFLTVHVTTWEHGSRTRGMYFKNTGLVTAEDENRVVERLVNQGGYDPSIFLYLPVKDELELTFIAAHEFVHLITDQYFPSTGYNFTDRTYANGVLVRRRLTPPVRYGMGLNECIAYYIGFKAAALIYSISYDEVKEILKGYMKKAFSSFERLLALFNDKTYFPPNKLFDSSNVLLLEALECKDMVALIQEIDLHTYYGFWEALMTKLDEIYEKNVETDDTFLEYLAYLEEKLPSMGFMKDRQIVHGEDE